MKSLESSSESEDSGISYKIFQVAGAPRAKHYGFPKNYTLFLHKWFLCISSYHIMINLSVASYTTDYLTSINYCFRSIIMCFSECSTSFLQWKEQAMGDVMCLCGIRRSSLGGGSPVHSTGRPNCERHTSLLVGGGRAVADLGGVLRVLKNPPD